MPMVIKTDAGDWIIDQWGNRVEIKSVQGSVRGEVCFAYESPAPIAFAAGPPKDVKNRDGVLDPGTYLLIKVLPKK